MNDLEIECRIGCGELYDLPERERPCTCGMQEVRYKLATLSTDLAAARAELDEARNAAFEAQNAHAQACRAMNAARAEVEKWRGWLLHIEGLMVANRDRKPGNVLLMIRGALQAALAGPKASDRGMGSALLSKLDAHLNTPIARENVQAVALTLAGPKDGGK